MKYILVYIAILGFPLFVMAQEESDDFKIFHTRPENERFITNYSDMLNIKLYGIIKTNEISHVNHDTGKSLNYEPNESLNLGFGVGYKWFGLDVAFNFKGVNHDDLQFGKTKRFDLQSGIYTRKFAIDLIIQRYKGYYLSNPEDYISNFDKNGPYPTRPDMNSVVYGLGLLYVFKHDKFSYRAVFSYNERQIKSTGSFLAGPFFRYFRMDADSSLIISEAEVSFDTSQDFRGSEYIRVGVSAGYGYTLVLGKRVFASLSMVLGLGPEIKKTPAINGQSATTDTKITGQLGLRMALGYNSERFYFGASGVAIAAGERDREHDYLERGVGNNKIFVGYRFNPPKFLLAKKQ